MTEIRIGDAEREAAVGALGEHYAAGRLTKEEYDERAERAWTAKTSSALAPLFADLPQPHGAPTAPRPGALARSGATGRTPAVAPPRPRFHPPFVPMVAIFVGIALLTDRFWVFWVLLGAFWWSGHAFRRARREYRYQQWSGWAGPGPHRHFR